MKAARLPSGDIILADQYKKAVHGDDLVCADAMCSAHMGHRREYLAQGASAIVDATFVSRDVTEHRKNCTAHDAYPGLGRITKSLVESVEAGKSVVINLNMPLQEDFNTSAKRHRVFESSTYSVSNYKAVGAKNVEDVLHFIDAVRKAGGEQAIQKTYVNYLKKTMPVSEFIVDTPQKYTRLLTRMWELLERNAATTDTIGDYPRMILFKPTANSRNKPGAPLAGTPITMPHGRGKSVIVLQKADTPKEYEKALRGVPLYIIAQPKLSLTDVKAASAKLAAGKDMAVFLDLHWTVLNVSQFTPLPRTPPAKQAALKF